MIELNSVTKRYGFLTAVDNVSFSVKTGEYFALLGPNGAGKTTIVRLLLDFARPTSGSLSIDGISSRLVASRTAVGYLAENHHIPPYLSGWQYLRRCAELLDISGSTAMDQLQGRRRAYRHARQGACPSEDLFQRDGSTVRAWRCTHGKSEAADP
jgi:ABC-2 type transport system ATP-binding protein